MISAVAHKLAGINHYWHQLAIAGLMMAAGSIYADPALAPMANTKIDAEKIHIVADRMQMDVNTGNSVYTGKVKISQGALVLTGNQVTLENIDNEVEQLTVIGKPARYHHVTDKGETIQAESEHMVYTASKNELVMTINAHLQQPDHKLSSQKIVYDTKNKIVVAGGQSKLADKPQRVNITLTPKKTAGQTPGQTLRENGKSQLQNPQ